MTADPRQLTQIRANLYGRLQFLYTYPLPTRKLEPLLQLWVKEERRRMSDEYQSPLVKLIDAVSDWSAFVKELNTEYKRLFMGKEATLVPAYASFYLNEKQSVTDELARTRQMYSGWNTIPIRLGRMPADNIAIELAFLGHLAVEGYQALVEKDEGRYVEYLKSSREFLRGQVLTWVPVFCQRMGSATQSDFFKWLSAATMGIIETDLRIIDELLTKTAIIPR